MIHVEKDFNEVPKFLKTKKVNDYKDKILKLKKVNFGNYQLIRKRMVKEIKSIYSNKCGFCESKLYESVYIEYYRPKSKYYWLFYEWSNIIPVCHACNVRRGNRFEIEGEEILEPQENREEWRANSESFLSEKPLLFHPEIDYPENYLYFTNDGYIHSDEHRGEYTIETCNLNRESLVVRRKDIIDNFFKKLEYLVLLLNKGLTSDEIIKISEPIFKELEEASDRSNEFSLLHKNMLDNFNDFFLSDFNRVNQKILKKIYESNLRIDNSINRTVKKESIVLEDIELIGSKSKDIYQDKEKILPYGIKQLHVQNFHGIKDTEFTKIPTDTQWIFLTGDNGFGKTTILQSLVLGLYGNSDENGQKLTKEDFRIGIEFKNRASNQLNNVGTSDFISFKNFVAYGSSRLNILKGGDINKTTQTYSLFHTDGYLLNIEDVLKRYAFREKHQDKFKNIINILCKLMPNIEKIEVIEQGKQDVVLYYEKDEKGEEHSPVEFEGLASGYKSIIAMFGDMIVRLAERQDISSPSDLEGIVIIDELDLHFHPNWQKKLPKLLSDTFPKIQFIVSTHSVIPFLGALENSVFLKVTRDEEHGVKLHKLDIDIKNLLPNTILTSPLFNFEGLIPSSNQKIENVRTEDLYNEAIFNQIVDEKLENIAKSGSSRLDNLFGK